MTRHLRLAPVFLIPVIVLVLTGAALEGQAEVIPFDEAAVFIEINDTDGDAGLQAFFDGEGWSRVRIISPKGQVFGVQARQSLRDLGLTEVRFESEEPGFDELSLEEFLDLFPEGEYKFVGRTIEGDKLVGAAMLSHVIPDAPVVNSPAEDEQVAPDAPFTVEWDLVSDPPGAGNEIVAYQVIVEKDEETERLRVFSFDMLSTDTSVTIPLGLLEPDRDYKVEVIAISANGNKIITEVPFKTTAP